jgi:hypothetical protein
LVALIKAGEGFELVDFIEGLGNENWASITTA